MILVLIGQVSQLFLLLFFQLVDVDCFQIQQKLLEKAHGSGLIRVLVHIHLVVHLLLPLR